MKKTIGLYGGTFNPIHFGHLNLAIELKEKKNLSEVWVIPAHISPLAKQQPVVSAHHRFKMAEITFSEIPDFHLLDLEIRRPPPSYTIDTVKKVLEIHREKATFYLMMGDDNSIHFNAWKDPLEIVKHIPLLIGSRSEAQLKEKLLTLGFPTPIQNAIEEGSVEISRMEISATIIRERIKRRLYCGHLVPEKVLDYIYENQLYFKLNISS